MKKIATPVPQLAMTLTCVAQKTVYIPQQTLKNEGYVPSTTTNNHNMPWCRYRALLM